MKKLFRYWFWQCNRLLTPFIVRRSFGHNVRLHETAEPLPKAPFVMVANHGNFFDPWIICHYSHTPISIMMNEEGFKTHWFSAWLLRLIGAFPKKKGLPDIGATKRAILELKMGNPLMVFPEGQTTWDGATQPIYTGIEKIAKKMSIPLVIVRLNGNFVAKPWWTKQARQGQIVLHRKVLQPDTLKKMSPDQIRNEIINYITTNDIWATKDTPFVGTSLTQGMENLLWLCPSCKNTDTLHFADDTVTCSSCTTHYHFTANLFLKDPLDNIKTLYDWEQEQKQWTRQRIANTQDNNSLVQDDNIRLIAIDGNGRVITLDIGHLTLNKKVLRFEGTEGAVVIPVEEIFAPVFQRTNILQFGYSKGTIRFFFDHVALFKWLLFLRSLTGYTETEERGYYL